MASKLFVKIQWVRQYFALKVRVARVRYKYYKKIIVVLVWPGAAHAPIAVLVGSQQYVCAKFYPDWLRFGSTRAKNLFWSKNRERPSLYAWPTIRQIGPTLLIYFDIFGLNQIRR